MQGVNEEIIRQITAIQIMHDNSDCPKARWHYQEFLKSLYEDLRR